MSIADLMARQEAERKAVLESILTSRARKKIIVAGPGTGKTFTFGEMLSAGKTRNNIAMTFIRRLTQDMDSAFGGLAEVKTFHAYCKKILHQQNGRVELVPYLTSVIEKDAVVLEHVFSDFDTKFQGLDEKSPELAFYLRRGDYYEVVSFNDSVYRLYQLLLQNEDVLPKFDQILIDEYQDFNPLEVAFIDELEKRGPILIVGDDDQAIYDDRLASPAHLRRKLTSGEYERFELPYCSRCPQVIVDAANSIIEVAQALGNLEGRIPKRFECYLAAKVDENEKYRKIIAARCTNAQAVTNYLRKAIENIDASDIAESWLQGKEYPTVLIVGPKQYLVKIEKDLKDDYPNLTYTKPSDRNYELVDAYKHLLSVPNSNLGWRILAELFLSADDFSAVLKESEAGEEMIRLLQAGFVEEHRRCIEILRLLQTDGQIEEELKVQLYGTVGDYLDTLVAEFTPAEEEESQIDKTKLSILLTSFRGCKGLSAGYVFIVGANNGSMPVDPGAIEDVEIRQFLVALTRTRKQCHVISNKWLYQVKDKQDKWIEQFSKSFFLEFIPTELIKDLGDLDAEAIRGL